MIRTTSALICDRCGFEADGEALNADWAKIAVALRSTSAQLAPLGYGEGGGDLCPGCVQKLAILLFETCAQPTDQPAAPAPRPRFTLEERGEVAAQLVEAMRVANEDLLSAVRRAPSHWLERDVIVGVDDTMRGRANAIVKAIADRIAARNP